MEEVVREVRRYVSADVLSLCMCRLKALLLGHPWS